MSHKKILGVQLLVSGIGMMLQVEAEQSGKGHLLLQKSLVKFGVVQMLAGVNHKQKTPRRLPGWMMHTPLMTTATFPDVVHDSAWSALGSVLPDEILKVVSSMGRLLAPGVDGLQPIFFQSQWDKIGDSVVNMVRAFLRDGALDPALNETFRVLLPKVPKPEGLSQFRPISLCNVVYKVMTKLLTLFSLLCHFLFLMNNQALYQVGKLLIILW